MAFTRQFKRKVRALAGLALLAAGTVPFAAGLIAITWLLPSATGLAAAVVSAAALALGIGLPWLVQNHLALLGNHELRQRLAEELTASGYPLEGRQFVGFSPGDSLRLWEGETDRDVGFLELSDVGLVYRGDAFAWSLRRESIDSLELLESPGTPQRVVVAWHTPGQPRRHFSLGSREARTLKESNRATVALFRRLEQWYGQPAAEGELPTLGWPPTSVAGSLPLEKLPAGSCLSVLAIVVMTVLAVWYAAQRSVSQGLYYHGILWAGLITVAAMILASYFLSYLQSSEARQSPTTGARI